METWKAAICEPSREASEETTPASTEILGIRKTENFCWLGHLVRGALWWRPLLTDTARSPTRPAELPNVGPAGGGAAVLRPARSAHSLETFPSLRASLPPASSF